MKSHKSPLTYLLKYRHFLGSLTLTCSLKFSGFYGFITFKNEDLGSKLAVKTTHSSHDGDDCQLIPQINTPKTEVVMELAGKATKRCRKKYLSEN